MDRGAWWATYSPWGSKESDRTTDTGYHKTMPVCHKTGILKMPTELRLAVLKRQASYWQSVNKNWMRKAWRWRTRTTPGNESSIHQVGINTEDGIDGWLGYNTQLTLREQQRLINVGTFQENKGGLPYWIPASLVAQLVKNLSPVQETQGWEDPLEKGTATHSSILAWRFPRTQEPGGLQSVGSQRVRHYWATNTFLAQCCLQFQGQDMPVNNKNRRNVNKMHTKHIKLSLERHKDRT